MLFTAAELFGGKPDVFPPSDKMIYWATVVWNCKYASENLTNLYKECEMELNIQIQIKKIPEEIADESLFKITSKL